MKVARMGADHIKLCSNHEGLWDKKQLFFGANWRVMRPPNPPSYHTKTNRVNLSLLMKYSSMLSMQRILKQLFLRLNFIDEQGAHIQFFRSWGGGKYSSCTDFHYIFNFCKIRCQKVWWTRIVGGVIRPTAPPPHKSLMCVP